MYHIIENGAIVATVDRLQFWKRQDNGVRINCPEGECHGVYVGDTFYHLPWRPQSGGGEPDATYEEFSGVDTIAELDTALLDAEYQNLLGGI